MASFVSTYTAPKNDEELERRKALAASLKEFAANGTQSPETGKGLMDEAKKIGLTENNVKGLYDQYANPKPYAQWKKDRSDDAEARRAKDAEDKPAPIESSLTPSTPLLDRYDALQKSQGPSNVLSQKRSLESDTGRAMRMARRLQRGGFEKAAEQIALTGAETGLKEPALKSQDYASGMKSKNDASLAASQTFQTGMEEEAKLRRDLLKAQLEAFKNANPKLEYKPL
jgi:hypothetical protein